MSDLLRVVTLSAGGRPIVVQDLENGSTFAKGRGTLQVQQGQRKQQQAGPSRRNAGTRAIGESQDNATVQWTSLVSGANVADQTCANADQMIAVFENWAPGMLLEFRPDGASRSTFFDVRGPAVWQPKYDWAQFAGARSLEVDVQVPVAPVALLAPCDILDDFSVNSFGNAGVATGGNYGPTMLALSPFLYWRQGDAAGAGTVADASGNGRTGTPGTGVTQGVAGLLNGDTDKAASLDGSANAKITSAANPFTGNITVCGWANLASLAATRRLFGGVGGAGSALLQIETTGNATFWSDLASSSGTFAAGITAGTTFFWALTFNNTTKVAELFINGVSKGTQTLLVSFNASPGTFALGIGATNTGFLGTADETAVFTSVLTGAQILSLYNTGLGVVGPYTGGDYTQDAGGSSDLSVTGGQIVPAGTLTSERRLVHTARGYANLEAQATIKATPGATIASFKAGVVLRRIDVNNYVDVYVDDNGTNSRLRVDAIVAGVRTNRSTTNLVARVVNGTAFWVRGRIEGQVVIVEYFTSAPTPMATPTLTASYTLAAGEQTALVAGYSGFSWIPQDAAARLDDFEVLPRTYRNQTIPVLLQMLDQVPGTAPALMDVTVTPSGGAAAPVWAMLAWAKHASAAVAGAVAPFGIIPAETGTALSGWAVTADATYRGGSGLKVTTAGAGTFTATFGIDPSTLPADAFTDKELRVEVWARVDLASTLVSPTLKVTVQPGAGLSFGAERPTTEWGTAGKLLTKPSAGSVKRQVSLGTLPLITEAALKWNLVLTGTVAVGSTGVYGIDELYLVVKRQRALQASAKPNDATFPKFVASTSETSKTIRSDLRGKVAQPPSAAYPDAGMGGAVLEIAPVVTDLFVELSSLVPDDPTSDATSEQLSHSATIHAAITPRIFLFRGT
jgi:hypothetical protein